MTTFFNLNKQPDFNPKIFIGAVAIFTILFCLVVMTAHAETPPATERIADAIYKAEGGDKTSHPYGILAHYKHTTPRQACINTIAHAKRDWNGEGDFILFLQKRYCPIGAKNDPTGLNRNWYKNVKYFLAKAE